MADPFTAVLGVTRGSDREPPVVEAWMGPNHELAVEVIESADILSDIATPSWNDTAPGELMAEVEEALTGLGLLAAFEEAQGAVRRRVQRYAVDADELYVKSAVVNDAVAATMLMHQGTKVDGMRLLSAWEKATKLAADSTP